jgi:hypothetical protein
VEDIPFELSEEFDKLNLRIVANAGVTKMEVDSPLLQDIWKGQVEEEKIQERKFNIKEVTQIYKRRPRCVVVPRNDL